MEQITLLSVSRINIPSSIACPSPRARMCHVLWFIRHAGVGFVIYTTTGLKESSLTSLPRFLEEAMSTPWCNRRVRVFWEFASSVAISQSCMPNPSVTSLGSRLDPWLHDGNVVLAVEDKYFRVHRLVLSSASRVFHSMFFPLQPIRSAERERKIDGCPVVTLNDSAPEVQIVLKTLYTKPQRIPAGEPMHISVIAAFLRLGKKYEIRWLFDEASSRIEQCYPASLFSLLFLPPDLKCPITGRDGYDFQLINLAREFGLVSILPVAMYRCVCSCPLTAILDGYYDGTFHRLTPVNQKSCLMGRETLLELRSLTFGWLKKNRACCVDEVRCALGNFTTIAELWSPDLPSFRDPFLRWNPRWDARFCPSCMIYCHREIEDGREDAWDRLPSAFGFSSWEQLLGERESYDHCDVDSDF